MKRASKTLNWKGEECLYHSIWIGMSMIPGYRPSGIDPMEEQIANEAGVDYGVVGRSDNEIMSIGDVRSLRYKEGHYG